MIGALRVKIITVEGIISTTRAGKKKAMSGDVVKGQIDGKKFLLLEMLMLNTH